MLADEVTHVKMGSDWLRRLTADDPERRRQALEFQAVVDKLFSYGGTRSDDDEVAGRPRPPFPRARRVHRGGDRRDRGGLARRPARGRSPPRRRPRPLRPAAGAAGTGA